MVLMLENRSFDHMLGYLYTEQGNVSPLGHAFEGLTGNESNPDEHGNAVPVYKISEADEHPYFMPGSDPGEGYFATNSQLFSDHQVASPAPSATNQGFVTDYAYTLGWEGKSKGWNVMPGTTPSSIMGMYTPAMLPILSGLAKGYAVCDHWYCSVPTETLPNRAFATMATSQGRMNDKDKQYTAPTIFNALANNGQSWAIYGYDAPPLSRASYTDITDADNAHFGEFKDFQQAAQSNQLANYTFLEPQWGKGGNSQHPNYDVAKGEAFIQQVYDTLKNSAAWEKTLLIITYDEHGGCYDHVPPPANAVAPDSCTGMYGFDFTRFGPRVPTVLVSPLIAAGTVYRAEEGGTPLDHTAILKTLQTRFDLAPLTKRDAAAPDIASVLTLDTARTDDPLAGVKAPQSKQSFAVDDSADHLQQLYVQSMESLPMEELHRESYPDALRHYKSSDQAIAYGRRRYEDYSKYKKR
ncbi:phospholipase C [Sinobacterium caligoides]|uniref:Phospholipase C n=1 Tax=Sinobacterium caligoides TaxID=933926 RepID=A0A3N2DGZ2_9GAMM|nr:phospholipase C [Sinobacterium caligoides]